METTQALERLNMRRRENSFLIRTLENESNAERYFCGDSAAVLEANTGYWLFSIADRGDFTKLYSEIGRDIGTFYVNSCAYIQEIKDIFPELTAHEYVQYVLDSADYRPNPAAVNPEVSVVPLDESWVEFILSLYKSPEFGNEPYISECIRKSPGFGALCGGERVGYVTIHLDGEIGSMVISEKGRGKGIGRTLMQYITPKYAEQASIGCGFVLPDNRCSQRMMVNSCFTALNENIFWAYH